MASGAFGQLKSTMTDCNQRVMEKSAHNAYDHSIELEIVALERLATTNLPHVVELKGVNNRKCTIKSLLLETINGCTMYDLLSRRVSYADLDISLAKYHTVECKNIEFESMKSLVARLLIAVDMINEKTGISHSDLHMANVMIQKTDDDVAVYEYRNKTLSFLTYGIEPILIDFGMAFVPHIGTMLKSSSLITMGYLPFRADRVQDMYRIVNSLIRILRRRSDTDSDEDAYLDMLKQMVVRFPPGSGSNLPDHSVYDLFGEIRNSMKYPRSRKVDVDVVESLMCQIKMPLSRHDDIAFSRDEAEAIKSSTCMHRKLAVAYTSFCDVLYGTSYMSTNPLFFIKFIVTKPNRYFTDIYEDISLSHLNRLRRYTDRLIKCLANIVYSYETKLSDELARVYDEMNLPSSCFEAFVTIMGGGEDVENKCRVNFVNGMNVSIYNFNLDRHTSVRSITDCWIDAFSRGDDDIMV